MYSDGLTALVPLLCCVSIECVLGMCERMYMHACEGRDCYGTLVAYTVKNYH